MTMRTAGIEAADRLRAGDRHVDHAGQRANAPLERLEEREALLGRLVIRPAEPELRRHEAIDAPAGIAIGESLQAAQKQAGPGQQHECKRHLADDQRVTEGRMRARRRAARPIAQRAVHVGARREQRRDGSEQQSGQHRTEEREREHAEIQADARERQIDEQPPIDELEHAERDSQRPRDRRHTR